MRNVLSIDPSLAKCAVVVWNDNVPVFWDVFKSGGIECKKKLKSVTYFEKEFQLSMNTMLKRLFLKVLH